jgi:hypothetical protein
MDLSFSIAAPTRLDPSHYQKRQVHHSQQVWLYGQTLESFFPVPLMPMRKGCNHRLQHLACIGYRLVMMDPRFDLRTLE